jgi:hypothetical protein
MKIKFHSCQQEILASIPYIHTSVRIFADGDGELVSCTSCGDDIPLYVLWVGFAWAMENGEWSR